MGSSADSQRTHMKRLVTVLRRSGCRGYVPIETLSMNRKGHDATAEVQRLLTLPRDPIQETASITAPAG